MNASTCGEVSLVSVFEPIPEPYKIIWLLYHESALFSMLFGQIEHVFEEYINGEGHWVDAKEGDTVAVSRWGN